MARRRIAAATSGYRCRVSGSAADHFGRQSSRCSRNWCIGDIGSGAVRSRFIQDHDGLLSLSSGLIEPLELYGGWSVSHGRRAFGPADGKERCTYRRACAPDHPFGRCLLRVRSSRRRGGPPVVRESRARSRFAGIYYLAPIMRMKAESQTKRFGGN